MRTKNLALVGVAAIALALTGCSDNKPSTPTGTSSATSAAPQASAKDAFLAAADKTAQQTSKQELKMSGAINMTTINAVDPAAKVATSTISVEANGTKTNVELIVIKGEAWIKTGPQWMHVASDKVKPGGQLSLMASGEGNGAKAYTDTLVTVERDGENGFKGTLDLTKAKGSQKEAVKQLGDKAKAVPFSATVDSQGRFATFTVHMDGVQPGLGKMETTYSAYGEPVTATPPAAAQTVEAPQQIIDLF